MSPKIIGLATTVVEHDGLTIDEYVGNIGSKSDDMSVAVVKVSKPTSEPWLTLSYDEWMVVLKGRVDIHYGSEVLTANKGETIFIPKGERFRPVFPEADSEYIPICIPAFSPDRCKREEENGINTSEVAIKLQKLHSKGKPEERIQEIESQVSGGKIYHMCQKKLWEESVKSKTAYFPPTFKEDGNFTHATAVPKRLIETANHFYTSTIGDWICLELSSETLKNQGIVTVYEQPKPVGDTDAGEKWKENKWECPHIYGGIPVNIPGLVTNVFEMKRDEKGQFLSIIGLTDC